VNFFLVIPFLFLLCDLRSAMRAHRSELTDWRHDNADFLEVANKLTNVLAKMEKSLPLRRIYRVIRALAAVDGKQIALHTPAAAANHSVSVLLLVSKIR
jgi:hypothetical protein